MMRIIIFMGIGLALVALAEKAYSGKTMSMSSILSGFEQIGEGTYSKFKEWMK